MTPNEEANVENKVDQLIDIAGNVRRALNVRTAFVGLVGVVMVVLLAVVASNQQDLQDIAEVNRSNGEAIKNATGPEAQKRSADGLVNIKNDVRKDGGEEIDCRSRRQQARIPAPPNPNIPCKDQTDASIYPGILNSPARG